MQRAPASPSSAGRALEACAGCRWQDGRRVMKRIPNARFVSARWERRPETELRREAAVPILSRPTTRDRSRTRGVELLVAAR
jgi:hypothetical protein